MHLTPKESGLFLTDAELYELTRKRRKDCQVKSLNCLGIKFRERYDGSLVVLREHVQMELGSRKESVAVKFKPNFAALHA